MLQILDHLQYCSYGICVPKRITTTTNTTTMATTTKATTKTTAKPLFGKVVVRFDNALIHGEDGAGKSDPYLIVGWPGGHYQARFHKDTYYPLFNEEIVIPRLSIDDYITVEVMDKDMYIDDAVGRFVIHPHEVMESGKNGQTVEYLINGDLDKSDYVDVRSTWTPVY